MHILINRLYDNAPYFIILLCLTPDDVTCQGESAATQWVKQTICPCTLLTKWQCIQMLPYFVILLRLRQIILLVRGRMLMGQYNLLYS